MRVVLAEYERVASHLGVVSDLGKALEDDILLHGPLTYRNALRRVFDGATGSPLARGAVEPGGSVLRKGVDPLKEFAPLHGKLKRDAGFWEARARMSKKRLDRAVLLLDSIEGRPPAPAYRASGLESDLRAGVDAYGLYSSLAYRPAGRQGGTALDRALVLSKEIRLSLDLVEDVVSSFPVEPSTVEITSFAKGNGVGICESPEGAIEHVVYLGSGGHVMRNRINCETERLAAFAAESLAGVAYQDLAPAVVSFNLCAACGDR